MTSAAQDTVPSEKTWVHVASFCDANMVMAAAALLCSLKRHRSTDTAIAIHLFVDESVDTDVDGLVGELADPSFHIEIHRLNSSHFKYHDGPEEAGTDVFKISAQYRLKIDQYLLELDKVLYLDADTIVRCDLAPLWAVPFQDEPIAAVLDYCAFAIQSKGLAMSYGEHRPSLTTYIETEVRTSFANYFNSGVMLINLKQWRRENVGGRCIDFIRAHPEAIYPDQDALNHVVKHRFIALDPRWNSFAFAVEGYGDNHFDLREDCGPLPFVRRLWARDPWIIHFAWTSKPWIPDGQPTPHDAEFWGLVASTHFGRKAMAIFRPRDALSPNPARNSLPRPSVDESLGAKVAILPRDRPSVKGLPTISFVVINYNYGRFLTQCVESIVLQDYPLIECIIVDDASTDESRAVIADLQTRYPDIIVHQRPVNGGQSLACKDGFAASRGAFVAFIDADDYILPGYATTHVHAHLSMPTAVGFTSCDMAHLVNGEVVTSTYFEACGFATGDRLPAVPVHKLKRVENTCRAAQRQFSRTALPPLRIVHSDEWSWVWTPASGNVYRRDAVALFMDNPRLASLRTATDGYLNIAINAFTGSVLIDDTLAVYRIHGANTFTKRGPLQGFLAFAKEKDFTGYAAFCALEHVTRNFRQFEAMTFQIDDLSRALKRLELRADRHNPRRRILIRRLVSFATAWRWNRHALALAKVYDHRK